MRESEERRMFRIVYLLMCYEPLYCHLIDVFFSNERKLHVHSILQIEIQSLMLDAAALGLTLAGYEALLRCSELIVVFTQ